MLAQHALYGGRRDAMELGDLAQALALTAVALDSGMVQHQRIAADVLAFELCAPGSKVARDTCSRAAGHLRDSRVYCLFPAPR